MELWWRFCVHLMEKLWRFDGSFVKHWWKNCVVITESLWKFHGENPRLECGETVKNRKCGTFVWNRHTGKLQTGKTKDALQWSGTRNQLNGWKNVSENYRLGKHWKRQGGFDWGYLGNCRNNRGKALLLFGLPSDWIPCGYLEHFRVGKLSGLNIRSFFLWKKCYWNNRITDNQRANVVEKSTQA